MSGCNLPSQPRARQYLGRKASIQSTFLYICAFSFVMQTHARNTQTHPHAQTQAHTRTDKHTCKHIHTHTHTHTHARKHTQRHTHTHMHKIDWSIHQSSVNHKSEMCEVHEICTERFLLSHLQAPRDGGIESERWERAFAMRDLHLAAKYIESTVCFIKHAAWRQNGQKVTRFTHSMRANRRPTGLIGWVPHSHAHLWCVEATEADSTHTGV